MTLILHDDATASKTWEKLPVEMGVPENEQRVLILAPTANDARLTAGFMADARLEATVVDDLPELVQKMEEGCGAILIAEEVINSRTAPQFFAALREQPTWSDVPVTLIASGGIGGEMRMRRFTAFKANSNITVLERPFRPATLVSAMEAALRARRRQYQVRKLLAELGQARDAAEGANRAKDEFLAALSHELRTPLNPVLLLATEAAANPALPGEVREDFDQIARNVMLEARLIDDLLDLTRITQGKLHLELRPIDVHAALRAALETTQPEIREKKLNVEMDLYATNTHLMADMVRLQQILWNVLKNAAKFTPAGGRIRIDSHDSGPELVIRISDTGVGMEPDELARVFEAFAQGNHARSKNGHRFGGLGLGLAISRRLVELHGGKIAASSAGPGRGSTFTLRFPVTPLSTPPDYSEITSHSGSGRGRVNRLLVVEDHAATRLSLTRLLERRGYEVKSAGSLEQARALVRSEPFDLVLSDLGLLDGSGHELMIELREQTNTPGIALSGYGMEADLMQSKLAGFSAHLTKPVTSQALDAALLNVGLAGAEKIN